MGIVISPELRERLAELFDQATGPYRPASTHPLDAAVEAAAAAEERRRAFYLAINDATDWTATA